MSPEARQVLLDMKGCLSRGWLQGEFTSTDMGDDDVDLGASVGCLMGAAIIAGKSRGDTYVREAGPGRVFTGLLRGAGAGRLILIEDGSPTREALEALMAELGIQEPGQGEYDRIAEWNDAPGRTQQDVVDLIDRALAKTAPEQQAPARAREETHA